MFGSLSKKKKSLPGEDESGTASPSWLTESEPRHRGGTVYAADDGDDDVEEAAAESAPLISSDHDDNDEGYDAMGGGVGNNNSRGGQRQVDVDDLILTKSRKGGASHPAPDDNDEMSHLSWSEDVPGTPLGGRSSSVSVSASASVASSSRRGRGTKRSPSKKIRKSTRTMMKQYQEKIEERRRRMLSGLPRRSCCHLIFVFLNIVAVSACLCMLLSQVVPLFFVHQSLLQIVLRGYLTFFCVVFVVAELELPLPFIRSSQSLHNFISKGFQFTFVAVVGMEQAQASMVEETMKSRAATDPMGIEWGVFTALFVEVPAWIMLGVGILYMLMGVCCMRPVRDRCREDYAMRMEEYFEERQAQKDREEDMEDIEE